MQEIFKVIYKDQLQKTLKQLKNNIKWLNSRGFFKTNKILSNKFCNLFWLQYSKIFCRTSFLGTFLVLPSIIVLMNRICKSSNSFNFLSSKIHRKTHVLESIFINMHASKFQSENLTKKETLAYVSSCKLCTKIENIF